MVWTTRRALPPDWKRRVAAVRARAGDRCEQTLEDGFRCPAQGRECDHAVHRDDHRVESLQWLCAEHHRVKTQAEASAALHREKRPVGRHPGLL